MDEARTASGRQDSAREASLTGEASQGLGNVKSFVDLTELRCLLSRLATAELLRMLVVETFG